MKKLLRLLISLAVIGVGTTLTVVFYLVADAKFQQQVDQQVAQVHEQVRARFKVFDTLIANDEKQLHAQARQVLLQLSKVLINPEQNTQHWTPQYLDELATQYEVDGIYLIDKSTKVIATNFIPDLGFELGTISNTFNEYLSSLFGTGRLEVDRINVSSKTGELKIYAYYAPVGENYIIEVSYDVKKFLSRQHSQHYVDFLFGEFFTELSTTSTLLQRVDIYLVNNYAAFPFLNGTQAVERDSLPQIPKQGVFKLVGNNSQIHYYSQANLNRSQLHSAEYLAIRSTFNLSPIYLIMNQFWAISLTVVLIILAIAFFLISSLFDRWFLHRIKRIITALESSAEGDYQEHLLIDKEDELGLITKHINNMNARIALRTEELNEARNSLEKRVEERTLDLQLEIEARKEAETQLIKLAATDPLTHVLNRRAFDEKARIEIARAKRYARPLAIILLDLDHFKQINDQYGHQLGDKVLINIAKLITPCLRSTDLLCRHGGEEFIILLPETGTEKALQLAERLRLEIHSHPIIAEKCQFAVSASFGISSWNSKENDILATIHRADKAMYEAKDQGRNRVILYKESPEFCI